MNDLPSPGCHVILSASDPPGLLSSMAFHDVAVIIYVALMSGEGMPKADGSKGNLIIVFDILFPKTLTPTHRELMKARVPYTKPHLPAQPEPLCQHCFVTETPPNSSHKKCFGSAEKWTAPPSKQVLKLSS